MALTASTMLKLGSKAPDFSLTSVTTGKPVTRDGAAGQKGLLVMFLCCHCPYVKHVQEALADLGRDYNGKGVGLVAISSNDIQRYPDDAPPKLKSLAEKLGFSFPVCFDETQSVAKAYTAACTPDFFLFDKNQTLVYRGQLDDSRPGRNSPVTGRDLRAALDAVLEGRPVDPNQKPSLGCNIKWKPGNEPNYFG